MPPDQVRNWWLKNQYKFPLIFQMWRDYSAIPVTLAPFERVFSAAGNLVSNKRTRIASETIKYVICLRSWGLLAEADDDEEIEVIDLTDEIGFTDIIERVAYLHLLSLADRIAETALQKEEQEKADALRTVAGILVKDGWEAANQRRLD
jgi:hypothetical protein